MGRCDGELAAFCGPRGQHGEHRAESIRTNTIIVSWTVASTVSARWREAEAIAAFKGGARSDPVTVSKIRIRDVTNRP